MTAYEQLQATLPSAPKRWLVTGVAGFIGSNLLETLLRLEQPVVGLDNLSSGSRANLELVRGLVSPQQWARFRFVEGDLCELAACRQACAGAEVVLHQAALGSVPASLVDPLKCHRSNVTGFLTLLTAAREARIERVVYASSSAIYGDAPELPKLEEKTGKALSPYAASKVMDELYAEVFARAYGLQTLGLRYFNVFGPRQNPEGPYAAVIPLWVTALLRGEPIYINGDGLSSRDFCFVANVVQANLLAATTPELLAINQVYNVALGQRTSLNELFKLLQQSLAKLQPGLLEQQPFYRPFRSGDVRHSLADISKAQRLLGYAPTHELAAGLAVAVEWYRHSLMGPSKRD